MKQLQPVVWTKGTFLSPQHLQLQDRFLEDSFTFRLQSLKFCHWGFSELVIDQELLAEGQLTISRARGIFPDGLLFDIPNSDQPPPSRALPELFDQDVKTLNVYLTIPDYRQRGINISAPESATGSRYLSDVVAVRDENTGMGEKSIQVARKNLRLLAENETREGCSSICIANIERTEANTFRLTPRFVQPLLEIDASDYLQGLISGLIEVLSSKSTQLSSSRRQKNQSLADFTSFDIANFWLLYTVNSYIPVLSHLFRGLHYHPEELFSTMTGLAGSLTTFSSKVRPRDLPVYDHNDLGRVFADLDEKLRLLLETVVPTNLVSLPLKQVTNFTYATAIEHDKYFVNTRMYLAIRAEVNEEAIIQRVPQLVKVCSATHLEHLITRALPGIQLNHLSSPPSAIPVKLKYQYFSLSQSGAAWEAVTRARNLAAYVPGDFPNPEMELLILLPQAG
jgi:type VI secretion system protein ImpJ